MHHDIIYRMFPIFAVMVEIADAEKLSAQLANPCEFPAPNSPQFAILCQYNYHQLPYLCDPSGIMSRTETELLDRHVRRLSEAYNVTGCICAVESSPRNSACEIEYTNALRLGVVLVPFTSIQIQANFAGHATRIDVNNYANASLAFARYLLARWTASGQTSAGRVSTCPRIDLSLLYIQHWMPDDIRKSYIARVYANRLDSFKALNDAHQTAGTNTSPFNTILRELGEAIQIIDMKRPGYKPAAKAIRNTLKNNVENKYGTKLLNAYDGIPFWAYILGGGMVFFAVTAVYVGNCVSRRLTQQRKKSSAFRYSTIAEMNHSSGGPSRSSFGGFILGAPSCGITGGARLGANTKSSMMFRHFVGGGERRQPTGTGIIRHVQKI